MPMEIMGATWQGPSCKHTMHEACWETAKANLCLAPGECPLCSEAGNAEKARTSEHDQHAPAGIFSLTEVPGAKDPEDLPAGQADPTSQPEPMSVDSGLSSDQSGSQLLQPEVKVEAEPGSPKPAEARASESPASDARASESLAGGAAATAVETGAEETMASQLVPTPRLDLAQPEGDMQVCWYCGSTGTGMHVSGGKRSGTTEKCKCGRCASIDTVAPRWWCCGRNLTQSIFRIRFPDFASGCGGVGHGCGGFGQVWWPLRSCLAAWGPGTSCGSGRMTASWTSTRRRGP